MGTCMLNGNAKVDTGIPDLPSNLKSILLCIYSMQPSLHIPSLLAPKHT